LRQNVIAKTLNSCDLCAVNKIFNSTLVNAYCVDTDRTGVGDSNVDTNHGGEIQGTEAAAVRYLNVSSCNISSLAGIKRFTSIKSLNCQYNQLTSLNVQSLASLQELHCENNPLSCLLFLPNSLTILDASSTNINCLSNFSPNLISSENSKKVARFVKI
jgi:hypothetical protein